MKLDFLDYQSRQSPLFLDSLQIVRLLRIINELFAIEIPLQVLMKEPSLLDLATYIENAHDPEKIRILFTERENVASTIKKDMQLQINHNKDILTQETRDIQDPKHILLTGATGFIGIFILEELLKQTSAIIYCAVRGFFFYFCFGLVTFILFQTGRKRRIFKARKSL